MPLSISVFSDVVCPWCYLGKKRLEAALDEAGLRDTTAVEWLPYELNPDFPETGMARADYRAAKFGQERSATLDAEMTERGRQEGVAFAFDRIARTPNTRKAHRLIAAANKAGLGDPIATALFRAYFEEGRDIGDEAVLIGIATQTVLDRAAAEAALADQQIGREVAALEAEAARIGVSGVPFFIVDRSWAVSGAQPADAWIAALRERVGSGEGLAAG